MRLKTHKEMRGCRTEETVLKGVGITSLPRTPSPARPDDRTILPRRRQLWAVLKASGTLGLFRERHGCPRHMGDFKVHPSGQKG